MAETLLGAARLFASYYQIVICDDPTRIVSDDENWSDKKMECGFAGSANFRLIGTEADLNVHWIELFASDEPPRIEDWQRVTCTHFRSSNGKVHVMSVIDNDPPISAEIEIWRLFRLRCRTKHWS
jgi:hypothetical protein